jgi:hypothetical protein
MGKKPWTNKNVVMQNESSRSLFDINPAKPDTKRNDVVLQRILNTVTEGAMSFQLEGRGGGTFRTGNCD